jgi:hypothetical protein
VEVWRELIDFLVKKDKITREEAQKKAIWLRPASHRPPIKEGRRQLIYPHDKDSPENKGRIISLCSDRWMKHQTRWSGSSQSVC